MTIVQYLRDFPAEQPHLSGGLDKAVAGLAGALREVDPEVRSIVLCEGPRAVELDRPEGFRVRCFDNSTTKNKRFALAPSLCEFMIDDLHADLVVLHAIFNPSVFLMSRYLRKRAMKYLVAPHDPYHPAMFASGRLKKSLYWHLCEKPMLRNAAAVQVLDQRHEQFLRQRGVNTPVIEVGNGFSPSDVPDESSLSWSTDGPVRILFLGRLDPVNKGLDLLIDAFAQIAKSNSQIKLVLQGPDRGEGNILRAQIDARSLRGQVEILPPDFTAKSTELAARCDIFVLPSRFEGFGLSAMEAMLAGRPVIISNIAGLAPHVQKSDGGIVVDSTIDSIRAGIENLLGRRGEWKSIGLRGRKYVLENLTWQRVAAKALKEYRAIAQSSRPRQ